MKIRSAMLALAAAVAGAAPAVQAQPVKTGGEVNIISYLANFDAMSWDNQAWPWKMNNDQMGMESLLRGNLKKGPAAANEYNFKAGDFMPLQVVEGSLAESYQVLENPLRVEFKLRPNVQWQAIPGVMEARPVVANDIVKHFEAMTKSPSAIKDFWSFVDRWEAKDPGTAVVYMKNFHGAWDYMLGWGYYDGIAPPERHALPAERRTDWRTLGGTGPYRLSDYRSGQRHVYTKNPNYWDSEVIAGRKYTLPLTDRIVIHPIRAEAAAIAALANGSVDILESVRWQFVDQLKKSAPELQFQRYNDYSGTYIALRTDKPPFNDVRVRRALNMAVDKQAILKTVMNGTGEIMNYPFSASWTGYYQPVKELSAAGQELFTYNPRRAKELLAEAGQSNLEFDVLVNSGNETHMDVLPMVQAFYQQIGVKMNLKPMEVGAYQAQRRKEDRTAAYMIDNGSGTPIAVLRKSFQSGQAWNASFYTSDGFDKRLAAATAERDDPKRVKMLRDLNRFIIEEEVPHVWLPSQASYTAWWPWVKNYNGELAIGAQRQNAIYARIWIDEDLKRRMGKR